MTSNDDSRDGKTPTGSNISGKRPHATLDLKAVEIKDRSGKRASTPGNPLAGSTPQKSSASKDSPESASKSQAASGMTSSTSSSSSSTPPSSGDSDPPKEMRSDTTPPPPQIVKRRGGFFGPLLGGIIGGALALFGGDYALQRLGLPKLAGAETQHIDAIEARMGDLEQQISSGGGVTNADGSANAQSLDVISSELEKLKALSQTTAGLVDSTPNCANKSIRWPRNPHLFCQAAKTCPSASLN